MLMHYFQLGEEKDVELAKAVFQKTVANVVIALINLNLEVKEYPSNVAVREYATI